MKTFWLRITASVLVGLFFFSANAQDVDLGDYRIGIRGGLSAANLLFTEAANKYAGDCPESSTGRCLSDGNTEFYTFNYQGGTKNTQFGVMGGLFVERSISDKLAVELGLNYEQKGIDLKYTAHSLEQQSSSAQVEEWRYYKRDLKNDYIVLPLVVKYKFDPAARFYITAGVFTSFLIRSAGTAEDSSSIKVINGGHRSAMMVRMKQKVTKELTSTFDAGVVGGGGVAWPLGDQLALTLDARLNVGLVKVDRKYNNRYEETTIPTPSGFSTIVVSENYYRGLNSQARNINLTISAGISKSF